MHWVLKHQLAQQNGLQQSYYARHRQQPPAPEPRPAQSQLLPLPRPGPTQPAASRAQLLQILVRKLGEGGASRRDVLARLLGLLSQRAQAQT